MAKLCDKCFQSYAKEMAVNINVKYELGKVSRLRLYLVEKIITLAGFVAGLNFNIRIFGLFKNKA